MLPAAEAAALRSSRSFVDVSIARDDVEPVVAVRVLHFRIYISKITGEPPEVVSKVAHSPHLRNAVWSKIFQGGNLVVQSDSGVPEADPATFTATSASGAIAVRTTERGQPLRLRIRQDELYRQPDDLAAEIVALCRHAADRGALARRAQLEAAGMSAQSLAAIGVPTREQVARAEFEYEQRYGADPQIWSPSN